MKSDLRIAVMRFRAVSGAIAFTLALLVGQGVFHRSALASEVTNSVCPVLTDEKIDESIFTVFEGKKVYFCCNKCRREFLANPGKYKANLPQFASPVNAEGGHATDSAETRHDAPHTGEAGSQNDISENAGHNHTTDHNGGELEFNLITYMGKFHPLATHFPVALIITAFIFSAIGAIGRMEAMDNVSIKITYFAAMSALVTMLLGLAAGSSASFPSELKGYFTWHRILGIGTTVLIALTSLFARRFERRRTRGNIRLLRLMLLISAVAVGVTGHLGASLVYGPDHYAF